MRVVVVGVVLLGLVLVGSASAAPSHPIRFPAITELASKIAGHPVDAYCEDAQDWRTDPLLDHVPGGRSNTDGYAWWYPDGRPYLVLRWDSCAGAVLMIADPNERRIRGTTRAYRNLRALGLLVLLHESNHLVGAGDLDEGAVECRAISSFRDVALSLGADQRHADALYNIALTYHRKKPPAYQSVC